MFLPVAGVADNETAGYQLAVGKLVCDANPCTSEPCLPGMIMYIERLNGSLQALTIDGSWVTDCFFDWNGFEFEDGDSVILIGQASDIELEIKFIFHLRFLQAVLN